MDWGEAKRAQKEAQRHAYALLCQRWAEYTRPVLAQVDFFPDHKAIEAELIDHLEERCADYQAQGQTPAEAKASAIADMGDAHETGRALNSAHSPLFGWIWVALRGCTILLALILACNAFHFVSGTLRTCLDLYPPKKDVVLLETTPLDAYLIRYGMCYRFDEVRYYDDNSIELCYTRFYPPLQKRIVWSDSASMEAFSAEGERIEWKSGGGYTGGGWMTPVQQHITFEEDAPTPRILYLSRGMRMEQGILIDLETGEVIA